MLADACRPTPWTEAGLSTETCARIPRILGARRVHAPRRRRIGSPRLIDKLHPGARRPDPLEMASGAGAQAGLLCPGIVVFFFRDSAVAGSPSATLSPPLGLTSRGRRFCRPPRVLAVLGAARSDRQPHRVSAGTRPRRTPLWRPLAAVRGRAPARSQQQTRRRQRAATSTVRIDRAAPSRPASPGVAGLVSLESLKRLSRLCPSHDPNGWRSFLSPHVPLCSELRSCERSAGRCCLRSSRARVAHRSRRLRLDRAVARSPLEPRREARASLSLSSSRRARISTLPRGDVALHVAALVSRPPRPRQRDGSLRRCCSARRVAVVLATCYDVADSRQSRAICSVGSSLIPRSSASSADEQPWQLVPRAF